MILNSLKKVFDRRFRLVAFVGATIALSGCVSSTAPILGDAKAILGERGQFHLYTIRDGAARDPAVVTFRWNGSRYVVSGKADRIKDFTVHSYEGRDLIVQSVARGRDPVEYALARRLTDGVYRIVAITEDVADDATRARFCTKTQDAACRITTPEQLFVFARLTADSADEQSSAGLAVIVPSERR
jgi:hypothetical protein